MPNIDKTKYFDRWTYISLLTIVLDNLYKYGLNDSEEYEYVSLRLAKYEEDEYNGEKEVEVFDFSDVLDTFENNPTIFAYLVNRLKFDLRENSVILPLLNNYLNK